MVSLSGMGKRPQPKKRDFLKTKKQQSARFFFLWP